MEDELEAVQNNSTILPLHQSSIPSKNQEEVNNESTVQRRPTGAWANLKKLFAQNVEARGALAGFAT